MSAEEKKDQVEIDIVEFFIGDRKISYEDAAAFSFYKMTDYLRDPLKPYFQTECYVRMCVSHINTAVCFGINDEPRFMDAQFIGITVAILDGIGFKLENGHFDCDFITSVEHRQKVDSIFKQIARENNKP